MAFIFTSFIATFKTPIDIEKTPEKTVNNRTPRNNSNVNSLQPDARFNSFVPRPLFTYNT